jgi:hypothetical protein
MKLSEFSSCAPNRSRLAWPLLAVVGGTLLQIAFSNACRADSVLVPNAPEERRAAICRELLRGSLDDGERMLGSGETGAAATPRSLALAYQLCNTACTAARDVSRLRALQLAERAFGRLDWVLADASADQLDRASASYLKAYVFEVALKDTASAREWALRAIKLTPEHAAARALVDRIGEQRADARVFGLNTPRINASYATEGRTPRLSFAGPDDVRQKLSLKADVGNYLVESSRDLLIWEKLWTGNVGTTGFEIDLQHADEEKRFYRVVPAAAVEAK